MRTSVLSPVPSHFHSHHNHNHHYDHKRNDSDDPSTSTSTSTNHRNQSNKPIKTKKKKFISHPSPNFYINIPMRSTSTSAGTKRKRGLMMQPPKNQFNSSATSNNAIARTSPSKHSSNDVPASPDSSQENGNASEWSSTGSLSDPNSASSARRRLSTNSNSPNGRILRRGLNHLHISNNSPKSKKRQERSRSRSQTRNRRVTCGTLEGEEEEKDEDLDEEQGGDEQEQDEDERLLRTAPSWQLHRRNKSFLEYLNRLAGTFQSEEEIDDNLTKEDLIAKIINARSLARSRDAGQEEEVEEEGGEEEVEEVFSSSSRRSKSSEEEGGDANSSRSRRAQRRDQGKRRMSKGKKKGASNQGGLDLGSETDFSNDAGGEETEAEPTKEVHQEQRRQRKALRAARGAPEASSSFGTTTEPFKRTRTRLRDNPSPNQAPRPGVAMKALRRRNSGYLSTGGNSSPVYDRSRQSRSRNQVFAASSPIRTRARSRQRASHLSLGSHVPTNRSALGGDVIMADATSRTPRPKRRGKKVAFETEKSKKQDDEWVETSPASSRSGPSESPSRPLRQSKKIAQEKMKVDNSTSTEYTETETNDATTDNGNDEKDSDQSEEEDDEDDGGQSDTFMEEATPVKSKSIRNLRTGKSLKLYSSSSSPTRASKTSEPPEVDEAQDEMTDTGASPSKIRKLRNGKLRLMRSDENLEQASGSQDVEMVDAADQEEEEEEDEDDPMSSPTASSLNRLRRAELVDLCVARDVDHSDSDKKADLINSLLHWFNSTRKEQTATATARKTSTSSSSTARGSPKRVKEQSNEESLLLRSKELEVQSSKPSTPPLSTNNAEAAAPAHGDGVDELNGLDLESLNLLDKEIAPSKLEKLEKIGSGGFKDVYIGKYHISKTRVNKVAIADIRDHLTEMDIKEISLLRDLKHENIVRFIGVSIPEGPKNTVPCMIVSELCSNGDLFDYIRNVAPLDDEEIFRIMLETARGLEYLHTRTPAIIHRDVKSTNVLVTKGRVAKINDFGLARVKNTTRSMMRSLVGTVNWQGPELWVPKPNYNEKVDVWSTAMTFWETLQWHQPDKKYPFQGMNEHQIYLDVGQKKQRPYTGFIRRQFGGEIVDLLDKMWSQSPRDRPTMTEVCSELETLIHNKKAYKASLLPSGTMTRAAKASR